MRIPTAPPRWLKVRYIQLTVCWFILICITVFRMERQLEGNAVATPTKQILLSSCLCVDNYLKTLQNAGIKNGVSFEEWEKVLCHSTKNRGSNSTRMTSNRALVIGSGPGSTATRSFAVAISLLRKRVLHYAALRKPGKTHGQWGPKVNGTFKNIKFFRIDTLEDGFASHAAWKTATTSVDFLKLFKDIDAIFDYPFAHYTLDILKAFPNSKILMTHRDPKLWHHKRSAFCFNKGPFCDVPYVMRPLNMKLSNFTIEQTVISFEATEEFLKCTVGPDRYLQVDAWNPPASSSNEGESDWFAHIAAFLGVPVPPFDMCSTPRQTEHDLGCPECAKCLNWTTNHKHLYDCQR